MKNFLKRMLMWGACGVLLIYFIVVVVDMADFHLFKKERAHLVEDLGKEVCVDFVEDLTEARQDDGTFSIDDEQRSHIIQSLRHCDCLFIGIGCDAEERHFPSYVYIFHYPVFYIDYHLTNGQGTFVHYVWPVNIFYDRLFADAEWWRTGE